MLMVRGMQFSTTSPASWMPDVVKAIYHNVPKNFSIYKNRKFDTLC